MPATRTRKTKLLERRRPGAGSLPQKDEAASERSNGNDRGAPPPGPDCVAGSAAPDASALRNLESARAFTKRPAVHSLLSYNIRALKIRQCVSLSESRASHSLMVKDAYKFALPPLIAGALC